MANNDRRRGDDHLLVNLTAGMTVRDAARSAGMAERTAHRRLEDPQFRRRLETARRELIAMTVERMAVASTKAVDTLSELLDSETDSVRLGAARSILEIGMRMRQQYVLEKRLSALEAVHGGGGLRQPSVMPDRQFAVDPPVTESRKVPR